MEESLLFLFKYLNIWGIFFFRLRMVGVLRYGRFSVFQAGFMPSTGWERHSAYLYSSRSIGARFISQYLRYIIRVDLYITM